MFDSLTLFFVFSLFSLFLGFKNLEFLQKHHGNPPAGSFFPAVLAVVCASQFHHFRNLGNLEAMAWWTFLFLATTPLLGMVLFNHSVRNSVLRILASVVVWVTSFWWISQTFEVSEQQATITSYIPVGVVLFPWKATWRSWRHHQKQQQEERVRVLRAKRQQQQEMEQQAQKEKNEALLRDLIRDLGR